MLFVLFYIATHAGAIAGGAIAGGVVGALLALALMIVAGIAIVLVIMHRRKTVPGMSTYSYDMLQMMSHIDHFRNDVIIRQEYYVIPDMLAKTLAEVLVL